MVNEDKLVLILEDLDMHRIPLERQLEELGYPYRSAPSRQEFLQIYHETKPYAMILDNTVPKYINEFPEKDVGLNLSRTLRFDSPDVKIALHTYADSPAEEVELLKRIKRATDEGVVYLKKPVFIEDLKKFLEA